PRARGLSGCEAERFGGRHPGHRADRSRQRAEAGDDRWLRGEFGHRKLRQRRRRKCRRHLSVRILIPAARRAGWYARRVGVAAAREINEIPAARQSTDESRVRAAGMTAFRCAAMPGLTWLP